MFVVKNAAGDIIGGYEERDDAVAAKPEGGSIEQVPYSDQKKHEPAPFDIEGFYVHLTDITTYMDYLESIDEHERMRDFVGEVSRHVEKAIAMRANSRRKPE